MLKPLSAIADRSARPDSLAFAFPFFDFRAAPFTHLSGVVAPHVVVREQVASYRPKAFRAMRADEVVSAQVSVGVAFVVIG